jgi:hypothetical protein
MSTNILKMAGIGLAILAVVLAVIFFANRGSQIRLDGSIQQVRVQAMDSNSCVVIVDFRFINPADYPFVVRDATLHLSLDNGAPMRGAPVSIASAKQVFDYYSKVNPDLGVQYNEIFRARDRVEPNESMDRMIMARFDVSASEAEARTDLTVRVEEVDGAVTEIHEERDTQ